MKITKNEFGMTKDNQPISLYTIENASGASVTLSDYGCRIIKIMVPNKEGKLTDVILGLMNADEYLADVLLYPYYSDLFLSLLFS